MKNKSILIVGKNGYIGKNIYNYLKSKKYNIFTQPNKDIKYDIIIDCAYNGVRKVSSQDLRNNLILIYKLLSLKFDKLIYFSSGNLENSQINQNITDYFLSKKVIYDLLINRNNVFILNLYYCFGGQDIQGRFVFNAIKNYILKNSINIEKNILIPMIYIEDLIMLIENIINQKFIQKVLNVGYSILHTYKQIANYINTLDNYKVDIIINNEQIIDLSTGFTNKILYPYTLFQRIQHYYNILK